MKKKNIIKRNNIRTIKKSLPRFISLLVMALLGMFVFVGLTSTAPDMIVSLDKYLDVNKVYDIRLLSTMGFADQEVALVEETSGILDAVGGRSVDAIVREKESEPVIQINSILSYMNTITLLEGRLPKTADEILVETRYLEIEGSKIGDTIVVDEENLVSDTLTIVGTVDGPLYYNNAGIMGTRGSTNVGSGKISYYAYCDDSAFDMDYYTCIYATVSGAKDSITSYPAYLNTINPVIDELENKKEDLEKAVYTRIHDEFQSELDDAKTEADEKLSDAKAELDDAKEQLDDADIQLTDAKAQLDDANDKLTDGKSKLDEYKEKLDDAKKELDSNSQKYEDALNASGFKEEHLLDLKYRLEAQYAMVANVPGMEMAKAELQMAMMQLDALIEAGEKIKDGKNQYNESLRKYNDSLASYKENLETYNENLEKYESSKAEYDENLAKYNDAYQEYLDARDEADSKIADAQKDLDEMDMPSIYVYDRTGSTTYVDYTDDAGTIRNLATLFPMVFFGVAVLISLISMSRLVDDDRLEIGTLKSLGFANKHIISKYLSFALWATIIGSIIGAFTGQIVIPSLVNYIYKILFDLPEFVITTQPVYIIIGFTITIICVCGASLITALRSLKVKPSILMRPKPPKAGHRILLENITFIWNRLNFSRKVTIRNLFRFKGKAFVTIGGIAGCTALVLTGFGIKDSIVDVPSGQYYDIYQFDGTALISEDAYGNNVLETITGYDGVLKATYAQRLTCDFDDIEGYILVIDADKLDLVADFHDHYTGQSVSLNDGQAIINEKLATLNNIHVGDTIEVVDLNHQTYNVEISNIVTNLIEHFIYVSPQTFEKMGGEYKPNLLYFHTNSEANYDKDKLVKEIVDTEGVMNLTLREDLIKSVDDTLKSLNLVVWILIVLSALLAFVVLYNLSNINIVERKREIATLKVLGFYDREVDDYIIKETIILSILGIIAGLIIGIFLSRMVVNTIEVEKCRFINQIKPLSFVYSSIITLMFSIIVSIITHWKLKKVDMIESLKSVE